MQYVQQNIGIYITNFSFSYRCKSCYKTLTENINAKAWRDIAVGVLRKGTTSWGNVSKQPKIQKDLFS